MPTTDFQIIDANWGTVLEQAAASDHSELRIICPFIKHKAAQRLLRFGRPAAIQVLTRFNLDEFCGGVNDLSALRLLLDHGAEIKGIRNLHAKLYLFGDTRAVATSANLTEAALRRNHEFGFVAEDPLIVERCKEYFTSLWSKATTLLTSQRLDRWQSKVDHARACGAGPLIRTSLGDEGEDIGLEPPVNECSPFAPLAPLSGRAFVKFFGTASNRAERTMTILKEVDASGSHWACTYGRPPRQVRDEDVLFMARLVKKPEDSIIYGRAVGIRHDGARDNASPADLAKRPWKKDWPYYIRVRSAEFIGGSVSNGVSLSRLMNELGSEAFATTQDNSAAGVGNTNPRASLMRQPAVRLSSIGHAWLQREFETALARHGRLSAADLATLDWPPAPALQM